MRPGGREGVYYRNYLKQTGLALYLLDGMRSLRKSVAGSADSEDLDVGRECLGNIRIGSIRK